ncbi:MAG TPA: SufD family Fe-S cluster assembly protein, partial [Hadesarchaea archaeon]|nr:SufD family Fe-S cluster assembly protein [Hadesarchaea archaeon]
MLKGKKTPPKTVEEPALPGPDLDIRVFKREAVPWPSCAVSTLPKDITQRALSVGVSVDEKERSGTYFQIDKSAVFKRIKKAFEGKAEVMSTKDALKKYRWAEDYWWRLVNADADKYTSLVDQKWDQGYFIRIFEGQKIELPLQACLFVSRENFNQNVHNLIIAEPDSEAQIITGCTVHPNVHRGLHVGVSEFYVKKNAKLTFTMVHNWAQNFDARPRTAVLVDAGATFVSNYICLKPVRSLQMYPVAYCRGANSRASFNTILHGGK